MRQPIATAFRAATQLALRALTRFVVGLVVLVPWNPLLVSSTQVPSMPQPSNYGVAGIPEASTQRVQAVYAKLPTSFEPNQGQTDARVKFLARGSGYVLFLTPGEAVLAFTPPQQVSTRSALLANPQSVESKAGRVVRSVVRMRLAGANPEPAMTGWDRLPGKVNYFIGYDPAQWRTNIPTYRKVMYKGVYPGIDLAFSGNQGRLEYDFIVHPGANPSTIGVEFQGADRLEVNAQGDLILHTAAGPIHQHKPVVYQESSGIRKEVAGGYVLTDKQLVTFRVASYDVSQPLIIDPVLFYSTYLGGNSDDGANGVGIAVDASGNAYITGDTASTNFPTTKGGFQTAGFQTSPGEGHDAFVTKLNPTGSALVYSTYLGGSDIEYADGIAIDQTGNAYVTGFTRSTNFPTTPGAFQTTLPGPGNAFMTKLNPSGSGLVYSTYLGGSGYDRGNGIALDTLGNAYVTGSTESTNFPTTLGAFQTTNGASVCCSATAFVTKLNSTGTGLLYSTYLGGSGFDQGNGIAVDAAFNAHVTGYTSSRNFPTTTGAFQTAYGGGIFNAFVTTVNPLGTGLVYSTYLGGSGGYFGDGGHGIAVDALGNVYVTGSTNSVNFPITAGAFQTTIGGGGGITNAFVTKLNSLGNALVYSTFLGGTDGNDGGSGITVDALGNAYVTGEASSTNFPTTMGAFQSTYAGGCCDAFVTKLNSTGSGLVYSTYLGGNGFVSLGVGIAVDTLPNPNAYVAGVTTSTSFATTTGAYQTANAGGYDVFVTKIANIVLPPGATSGKVTGGGTINVSGGIANFGFIVQGQSASGPISGDLQYVNHASGAKVHSLMFNTFTISRNTATFSGTCTNNGALCTFSVMAQDNGTTGENDVFTISIDSGSPEGGTLSGGKIQIHKCPCQ